MSDRDRLAWWCQSCREAGCGMVHCAHPEECGGMKQIPYEEAERAYNELRARRIGGTNAG